MRCAPSSGLNQPFYVQYLSGSAGSCTAISATRCATARRSSRNSPSRLPVTFELGILGLIISLVIAIPLGVYSAVRQDIVSDFIARSAAIAMLAIPGFWLATLAITLPSIWFNWTPPLRLHTPPGLPGHQPQADAPPGDHPRHRPLRVDHAADARADARSAAPRVCPHRALEGAERARGRLPPRPAQRDRAGHHPARPAISRC